MELKFYLNKFIKADNIEGYTLKALYELKKSYDKFIKDTNGLDPDYPGYVFGDAGSNLTKGKTNIENLRKLVTPENLESFSLDRENNY